MKKKDAMALVTGKTGLYIADVACLTVCGKSTSEARMPTQIFCQ